jgi:hypothetical protein
MWEYNNLDELYHYGVPGMRWGHRKNSSVMKARKAYKQAAKAEGKAYRKRLFSASYWIAGHDNVKKDKAAAKNVERLGKKREKAAFKAIDSQAKYAYDKKLAKTGNKAKAEKAAMKVHSKAFSKIDWGSGLPGSAADQQKGDNKGGNSRYYKHLAATKGKTYANKVEKKYRNKLIRNLVGAAVVTVGAAAAQVYLETK